MIVSYLIDWGSIKKRIEENWKDLAVLNLELYELKLSVKQNGVLLKDSQMSICRDLNESIRSIEVLCDKEDKQDQVIDVLIKIKNTLQDFQTLYENQGVVFALNDQITPEFEFENWIKSSNRFLDRITNREVCPLTVLLTDRNLNDIPLGNFEKVSIEEYCFSEIEIKRQNLLGAKCFRNENRKMFFEILDEFSISSLGVVQLIDPYFGLFLFGINDQEKEMGYGDVERQSINQQYSIKDLLIPFLRNENVSKIQIFCNWEKIKGKIPRIREEDDIKITPNDLKDLKSNLAMACSQCKKNLIVQIIFVKEDSEYKEFYFHDRFLVTELFTLSLGSGFEIYKKIIKPKNQINNSRKLTKVFNERINVYFCGKTESFEEFASGKISNYEPCKFDVSQLNEGDLLIRRTPCVQLKLGVEDDEF